jgi:hypothetical protein
MEMENISTTLQEFLDGSLPAEDEAELLHRLSVSPERRDLLRSFMKQQAVIGIDRATIAVPYKAEQKLWAALAEMPPFTAPVMESAPAVVRTGAVATSAFFKITATAVVAVTIGFLSGYFFGGNTSTQFATTGEHSNSIALNSSALVASQQNTIATVTHRREKIILRSSASGAGRISAVSEAPLNTNAGFFAKADISAARETKPEQAINTTITETPIIQPSPAMIREPNGTQIARPHFWDEGEKPTRREPSLLDRLELAIHEGLGKEFPNSAATNVSMPYFTNSDITLKYMILPELWIGMGAGYANMNQKHLTVSLAHPNDPTAGEQVDYEYVHEKTGWAGGMMEYRIPIASRTTLSFNAGVAASSLGAIYSSEVGARFEVSDQVGVISGIRVAEVGSNAAKQLADIRNSGTGKLGIVNGADTETPNYNVELSTGIYFRF